jgi:hypothetical protein
MFVCLVLLLPAITGISAAGQSSSTLCAPTAHAVVLYAPESNLERRESSNVTVAPETKAPVGSLTTPRREVVAFWAKLLAVQIDNNKKSVVSQIRLVKDPSEEK